MHCSKILQFGNPNLTKVASPLQAIKIKNKENQKIINNLIKIFNEKTITNITASQVDMPRRIIIIRSKPSKNIFKNQYRKERIPLLVIVNPWVIEKSENKVYDWEKCCSINENKLYAIVPRYEWIKIGGFNEKGKKINITAKGFNARLIQHSIDHLNGLFFFERMNKKGLKFLSSDEEWYKHQKKLLLKFNKSLS